MSKQQTFLDKLTKVKAPSDKIKCPACKQESAVTYARFVDSRISEKTGAWKFLERKVRLCGNCGAMV